MAVALDLPGDPNEYVKIFCLSSKTIPKFSIHPRTKHDVGYRLSRAGLAVAYGKKVEFQGPIVQNVAYSTGSSTVNITYTAVSSIELRNSNGFEVYNKFPCS
jgi:sialate O-acetylesterase